MASAYFVSFTQFYTLYCLFRRYSACTFLLSFLIDFCSFFLPVTIHPVRKLLFLSVALRQGRVLAPNGSLSNRDHLYLFVWKSNRLSNLSLQIFRSKVNKNFGAFHYTIKIAGVHACLINKDKARV